MSTLNILLASAGRRPYLVKWFREALNRHGIPGKVLLADSAVNSAASAFADLHVTTVPAHDPFYEDWLRATISEHHVGLALSVNDFELSIWSRLGEDLHMLVRLDPTTQQLVEDKRAMAEHLSVRGILVPETALGSEIKKSNRSTHSGTDFIVKSRYGSGSRGLLSVPAGQLDVAVRSAAAGAYDRDGQSLAVQHDGTDHVVVQPRLTGQEFGVDVISDLDGSYASVLVRRKLAMRAGETDSAMTMDPDPFAELAQSIARAVPHRGLIDTDVIQDEKGRLWVIDVNPRFGGGYPFSHKSGADVPAAYVAWATGRAADPHWLRSEPGVVAAKYVDIAVVSRAAE